MTVKYVWEEIVIPTPPPENTLLSQNVVLPGSCKKCAAFVVGEAGRGQS